MAVRYDLSGRTVLITGPARGIGAEAARQLARRGAKLALVGLEPERLERLAAELGGEAAWWEVDVRDADQLEAAVSGVVERFGGIDVAVANAGIGPAAATVATAEPEGFERVIDVNLLAVWRTMRAVLPHVSDRRGYLLPIASLAAAIHGPLMGPYNVAKAGVEALGNTIRLEVGHKGVDVGVGYFGFIDTDMVREGRAQSPAQRMAERTPRFMERALPVEAAGAAIVRGIERRSRRVIAPRWILPILLAPAPFQALIEAGARRNGLGEVIDEAERAPGQTPEPGHAPDLEPQPAGATPLPPA
jgi:NAD(P)-dependent dehydrogenase (short-subunit alcohol dehydrogenase family)